VLLLLILSRGLSIYLSALVYSLGFSSSTGTYFKLKVGLFLIFVLLTVVILRTALVAGA